MSEDRAIEFDGHTLTYRDSDHAYMLDGKRVVSVSSLAKVAYNDPGGLMTWAWNHGKNNRDFRDEAKFTQECGNAAHAQLEALAATGQALDLSGQPERVRGALQAVAKWWLDMSPTFVASEVMVCSPIHNYAGRFDFLVRIDEELFLGDLKTTDKEWDHFKKFKASAAYAQLAGYAIAYADMYPDNIRPDKRAILHVNASGAYDWKPDLAPEHSEASFLSKVSTYRADQVWSKAYSANAKAA